MTLDGRPPRPRPRPKPAVPKAVPASSTSAVIEIEDEDSFFIRNRTRDAKAWKKLDQLEQQIEAKKPQIVADGDSDADFEEEPATRSPKHARKPKDHLPSWTKAKDVVRLLSEELTGENDRDRTPKAKRTRTSPKRLKSRSRSRSQSITPPPELSAQALQNARNVVRQALGSGPRPPSPKNTRDDPNDILELDPELAMIEATIRSQTQSQSSQPSGSNELSGGPQNVTIKVKWLPHPKDDAGQSCVWEHVLKRHDSFKQLFEETADMAAIFSDNLIVSYHGNRLFSSTTPHALGIWAEAEIEACSKSTYEYIRTHRYRSPSPTSRAEVQAIDAQLDDATPESDSESTGGEKIRLTLRSAGCHDITLTVRPTTKCEAIVREFTKRAEAAGASSSAKPGGKGGFALIVDGDKLDPSSDIGDVGLEDGDLVEVMET